MLIVSEMSSGDRSPRKWRRSGPWGSPEKAPRRPPEDASEAPGKQPHTTPHIYCPLESRDQEPGARNQPHITNKKSKNK